MPVDVERVRRLSPAALRIFRQQVSERAKTDPEYARLVSMPELSGIFQQREIPKRKEPPLWQKGLQTVGAPFQWISENITQPFGALVTSPFTPSVQGNENLPWFEREREEYKQWQEPTFTMPWGGRFRPTKGLVESIPWLAVPSAGGMVAKLGGVAAKGGAIGKAAQIGAKALAPVAKLEALPGKLISSAVKPITSAIKEIGWSLPSNELLNQSYKPDNVRKFAQWAEDKPIVGQVMKALGGESIFANPVSSNPKDVVRKAVVNRARLLQIGENIKEGILPSFRRFGNPKQILDISDDGIINTAIPKTGTSKYLNDILDNLDNYTFTTPQSQQLINDFKAMRGSLSSMLDKEGLKQSPKVHRIVKGIVTEDGKLVESKFGSDPSLSRIYETQEEAVTAHLLKGQTIKYGTDPLEIASYEIDRTVNRIARKRFVDEVKQYGKTAIERFNEIYPEKADKIDQLMTRNIAAKNTLNVVQRVISYKGESIPGATIAKIKRDLPELADEVTMLVSLSKNKVDKVLASMGRRLRTELKTSPNELKKAVDTISRVNETWRGQKVIQMPDIEDAINSLNIDNAVKAKVITEGYRQTFKHNREIFKVFAERNKDIIQKMIDDTKLQLSPLRTDRYKFLQGYAGRERLPHVAGEVTERPFNRIPEFRGKFFPDEMVTYMEKVYGDEGAKWARTMGEVGSMSRNLTAVLDDSAPFIQGLYVFGRNPVQWAKATMKQLEFLVKPVNFTKYMSLPEKQALHAEMAKYGSSIATFEPFEAMPQLEKLVAKIPKVGGDATKVIKATYGRAEAAFTGFGQVARDNLWSSLRKLNMTDDELQQLARSIDLMTGNISTKAMGISRTQRDLESAWVFYSPRFTRASMAIIGDVFKGGLTGNEARKAVGGLMASGAAMYLGVTKSLGQEPNFDPRSAKFMTIKVGDDHVGVGGMLYSLARLGGNLATVDSPSDLLKLDRFDNPFVRFMYSKSAPLTGMMVGLIEQQDYMGQPFESPADWAKFLAEKVTPFSIQPLWEGDPSVAGIGAQFTGMRTFPESTYEKRQEIRENLATEKYSQTWNQLTKAEQNALNKESLVKSLTDRLSEEGRETPESKMWDNYSKESGQIEDVYRKAVTLASKEFESTGDGRTFKDKVDLAKSTRRELYAQRERSPEFEPIQQYYQTPKTQEQQSRMNPLDVAREEYYKMMYSPDMYDQFGNYLFSEADRREHFFAQKYGQQALDYVSEYSESRWEEPQAVKMLKQARGVLEPYWQIENQVWSNYPPGLKDISDRIANIERVDKLQAKRMLYSYPLIVYARKQIALQKKQLKMMNPDIAQALSMFYSY